MTRKPLIFLLVAGLGSILGNALSFLAKGQAHRMRSEIASIYPDMTLPDIDAYITKFFKNYVLNKMDVFFYPFMNPQTIGAYVEIHGRDNLDAALARGKGALLVHPHFGNPQMLMPGIGHRGYDLCQVGQAPTDVYQGVRKLSGGRNIPAYVWLRIKSKLEDYLPVEFFHIGRVSLRSIYAALKGNRLVAMTVDGVSKGDGEWEFLGRKTRLFSTGPIRVAHKSGATLLPLFVSRSDNGRHVITIEREIVLDFSIDKEKAIEIAMRDFISRLEEKVKNQPWHYGRFLGYHDATFFVRN